MMVYKVGLFYSLAFHNYILKDTFDDNDTFTKKRNHILSPYLKKQVLLSRCSSAMCFKSFRSFSMNADISSQDSAAKY